MNVLADGYLLLVLQDSLVYLMVAVPTSDSSVAASHREDRAVRLWKGCDIANLPPNFLTLSILVRTLPCSSCLTRVLLALLRHALPHLCFIFAVSDGGIRLLRAVFIVRPGRGSLIWSRGSSGPGCGCTGGG